MSSGDPAGRELVSLWSVEARWRSVYHPIFLALAFIDIVVSVIYVIRHTGKEGFWLDWLTVVIIKVGAVVAPSLLVVAIIALLITEIWRMLSERYLKRRYEKGLQEGQEKEYQRVVRALESEGYTGTIPPPPRRDPPSERREAK